MSSRSTTRPRRPKRAYSPGHDEAIEREPTAPENGPLKGFSANVPFDLSFVAVVSPALPFASSTLKLEAPANLDQLLARLPELVNFFRAQPRLGTCRVFAALTSTDPSLGVQVEAAVKAAALKNPHGKSVTWDTATNAINLLSTYQSELIGGLGIPAWPITSIKVALFLAWQLDGRFGATETSARSRSGIATIKSRLIRFAAATSSLFPVHEDSDCETLFASIESQCSTEGPARKKAKANPSRAPSQSPTMRPERKARAPTPEEEVMAVKREITPPYTTEESDARYV